MCVQETIKFTYQKIKFKKLCFIGIVNLTFLKILHFVTPLIIFIIFMLFLFIYPTDLLPHIYGRKVFAIFLIILDVTFNLTFDFE